MAIAYVITAYKYPQQLARLVNRIRVESPNAPILVHVDRKADLREYLELSKGAGVEFIAERQRVAWGSFSMVRATMTLLQCALERGVDHVVLLSEQCYPIRPISELEDHLSAYHGYDFIDSDPVLTRDSHKAERYQSFYFPDLAGRFPRLAARTRVAASFVQRSPRTAPDGYSVYTGSTWWVLSRRSGEYVLSVFRTNGSLRRFFSFTQIPEEMYVHTVLGNSAFSAHQRPSITYAKWNSKMRTRHPEILRVDDVDLPIDPRYFVARKFDATIDSYALDLLDLRMGVDEQN